MLQSVELAVSREQKLGASDMSEIYAKSTKIPVSLAEGSSSILRVEKSEKEISDRVSIIC